jgi:ferredoxin-NADP reductase
MRSYVFIAGGIGITPFRSMVQSLLDTNQQAPITLFYIVHDMEEVLFEDVFKKAQKQLKTKVIYLVDKKLTKEVITNNVTAYTDPLYYISGPQEMVLAYAELLRSIGVPAEQIKTDLFTGYDS